MATLSGAHCRLICIVDYVLLFVLPLIFNILFLLLISVLGDYLIILRAIAAISAHFLLLILAWCRPGCIILDAISIVKQVTRAHVIDLEVL